MILACSIPAAFAAAILLLLLPERHARAAKWVALAGALAGLVFAAAGCFGEAAQGPWRTLLRWEWAPGLGISFHLAADGISAVLVLLTGLTAVAGVLFSWKVGERPRQFFACFLLIIGGVFGVFLSADLVLFFFFYELVIVPKYFLIAGWGSGRREYAAMKLTVFTVGGSALVLLGILGLSASSGAGTFDLMRLQESGVPAGAQLWLFPVLFVGFGVLAGLWPFHTWAPTGHTAAPTAASMLLAGVVMKLGSYGALRVAMGLLPQGFERWHLLFAALAGVGILWASLAALAQRDIKYVVAYSSVGHMGFVLLGLMAGNLTAVTGGVLQMFSHGIVAGLLFAVVGTMVYDRFHTRDLDELGRLGLLRVLPGAAVIFTLGSAASMGIPGFSGFIAELAILLGAWKVFPWLVAVGIAGVLLTGAFSLRALQKGFFGSRGGGEGAGIAQRLSFPEIAGAALLLAAAIGVGIFPQPFLEMIGGALEAAPFSALLFGGGAAP